VRDVEVAGGVEEPRLRAIRHLVVERGDGRHLVAQRRDVADHEETIAVLLVLGDRDDVVAFTPQALRRDAQATEVERFERRPDLVLLPTFGDHGLAGRLERLDERRLRTPGDMSRSRLEHARACARHGRRLERLADGTAVDGLPRVEVGRSHQHSDVGAAFDERRRERRHHRRRPGVVYPSGEEDAHLVDVRRRQQGFDLGFPEHEAGTRADVTTALGAFEDEAPGTFAHEPLQQGRRRHVEVGGDAFCFERCRLRRATSGDDDRRRLDLPEDIELVVTELLRNEAQDADPPGPAAEPLPGRPQQRPRFLGRHERKGEEGQATTVGDVLRERGLIGDPRHRSLRDRQCRAQSAAALGRQRAGRDRRCDMGAHHAPKPGHRSPDGPPPRGEAGGEAAVLADGEGGLPGEALALEARRDACPVVVAVGDSRGERRDPQVGPVIHAMAGHDARLGAVHRGEHPADRFGQRALLEQRDLRVDHDPSCAADDGGGAGVRADPTPHPDRNVTARAGHCRRHLLEQDESSCRADATAGFGSLGDEPVGAGRQGRIGLFGGDDLGDDSSAGVGRPRRVGPRPPGASVGQRSGEHDGVDVGGQVVGGYLEPRPDEHAECGNPLSGRGQRRQRGSTIEPEVEDAECPGPVRGSHDRGVGPPAWGHHPDEIATFDVRLGG
jgi:hypothetical protein